MRARPLLSVDLLVVLAAVTASAGACGFDPRPKSGTVACKPQGSACCPEGYLCVGRGAGAAVGASAGTCWNKEDLPLQALVAAHDHTPTVPNDPACLVTPWLPPVTGALDGGASEAGTAMDVGGGGLDGAMDAGWADLGGAGGTGGTPDAGADAPLIQDTAADVPMGTGGADGSGGSNDAGSETGGVRMDGVVRVDGRTGDAAGQDGGAVDAPVTDGGDVARDAAADAPLLPVDVGWDMAGVDTTATVDSPPALDAGGEAGGAEAGAG